MGKSGNPCERFTALCSFANWLITAKTEVPVCGSLEIILPLKLSIYFGFGGNKYIAFLP